MQTLSPPRALLAWIGYPAVLAASVLLASALFAWRAPAGLIATLTFLVALGLTLLLERALPHDPRARFDPEDALWLAVTGGVQGVWQLTYLLLDAALAPLVVAWIRPQGGLQGAPVVAQIAVALLLAEAVKYTLHRAAHTRPGLWPYHAAHHRPTQVYALNGARMHPVNLVWNLAADALVPLLLGLDLRAVVLLAALRNAVAALQHANASLRLGGWNLVFSTPDLHRWHHATDPRHARSNYGSTLIVWDLLLGTRALPDGAPGRYGIEGEVAAPQGVRAQLGEPWGGDVRG
jgi:sterol desaturase/sphingolipid hydroxylase (fatty acid hydroxylase superfamily)